MCPKTGQGAGEPQYRERCGDSENRVWRSPWGFGWTVGGGGVVFPSFISLIPLDTHTHARAHAHTHALQHGPSGKQRRTATSARTLADGQIVPRPVVTTERNQVVQVGVTELESFVTGDD